MNLWHIYAILYQNWRSRWPFNSILNHEKNNLKKLAALLPEENWIICDIGSGVGDSTDLVSKKEKMITMDITYPMAQILLRKGMTVIVADALRLPFLTGSFSLIQVIGVSEYIQDLDRLFREITRIGRHRFCYILLTSSPWSIITWIRHLTGHKIYPRSSDSILTYAHSSDLSLLGHTKTLSQDAFLFKKK